ncbi:hypothetical protein SNE510_56510 [Streptomyces sp. NE5-10]|nr:hypothetical protein SNE510_56510 [Streptomyces sp. NE5-10]
MASTVTPVATASCISSTCENTRRGHPSRRRRRTAGRAEGIEALRVMPETVRGRRARPETRRDREREPRRGTRAWGEGFPAERHRGAPDGAGRTGAARRVVE